MKLGETLKKLVFGFVSLSKIKLLLSIIHLLLIFLYYLNYKYF